MSKYTGDDKLIPVTTHLHQWQVDRIAFLSKQWRVQKAVIFRQALNEHMRKYTPTGKLKKDE